MDRPVLEMEGIEIVLIGNFNPKIFQPAWLAAEKLIGPQEAEGARIDVIHPELASFALDRAVIQVTTERFVATTSRPDHYELCRDLTMGIFQLLRFTPVAKMGINRNLHYRMPSEAAWHELGYKYAPKDPWAGVLSKPGLKSLLMQDVRPDSHAGFVFVRVEPSGKVHPGVYVNVNDHYDSPVVDPAQGCSDMINILRTSWSSSFARSTKIGNSIIGLDARGDQK